MIAISGYHLSTSSEQGAVICFRGATRQFLLKGTNTQKSFRGIFTSIRSGQSLWRRRRITSGPATIFIFGISESAVSRASKRVRGQIELDRKLKKKVLTIEKKLRIASFKT